MWKWLGVAALAALAVVAVHFGPDWWAEPSPPHEGSSYEAEGEFSPVVTTGDLRDMFGVLPTEADAYGLATGRTEAGGFQLQLRSMKESFEISPGKSMIVPGQGPIETIFSETWPRLQFHFRMEISDGDRKIVLRGAVMTFDDGIEFRDAKTCRETHLGRTFVMKAHDFDSTSCREPTADYCRSVKIDDPWLASIGATPRAAAMCIVETETGGKEVLSVYLAARSGFASLHRKYACAVLHKAIEAVEPEKVAGRLNACLSFVQGEAMTSKTVLGMELIRFKSDLGQSAP